MRSTLFPCLILLYLSSYSQVYKDYTPLKSSGSIPADFTTLSMIKFRTDVKQEKMNSKNYYIDKTKEEFLLKSNYIIDELLMSGKVLFNDSVSAYVNKVAAQVLRTEPDLQEKLRFYVIKSSVTNAFSTNQGIIFVTLGLIAQLENEAQLAYVLAHEISHYVKRHTINAYIENEKVFSVRGEYRYNSYDNKIRTISNYSKNLELEADSLGLIRYATTDFKASEVITAFDVMQFSYLPFGDIEFSTDFITQKGKVVIPKKMILDTVKEINFASETEDDSKSSHPNVRKRREAAEMMLERVKVRGTKAFIQPKELFLRIRTIARYESLQIDMNDRQYIEVIYNTLYLQQENPKSVYLQFMLAKALYGAAKYKAEHRYGKIGADYEDIEGNSQKCYYFFKQLDSPHLLALAFRHIYDLYESTGDKFMERLATDLMKDMVKREHYTLSFIQSHLEKPIDQPKITDSISVSGNDSIGFVVPEDSTESNSKYSKLRKQKKEWNERKVTETRETETPVEDKFHLMAFDEIYKKEKFLAIYAIASKRVEEKENNRDNKSFNTYTSRSAPKGKKGNPLNIGLDTMVIVDPFFFSADDRKGLKLMDSEARLLGFTRDIQKCGQLSGIHLSMIAPKDFKEADVNAYNDLAQINEWMAERIDHGDLEIIPLQTDLMQPLVEKYNTPYFCYTGVLTFKQRRDNAGTILFYGCIAYPIFPIMAVIALSPQNKTHYYTLVYDVNSGENVVSEKIELNVKSNAGYVNSVMYDQMLQMKKEPLEIKK